MRILVLGPIYPDSFARNIVATLEEMGHQVASVSPWRPSARFPYGLRLLLEQAAQRSRIAGLERVLRRRVQKFQPDVVLNAYAGLEPAVVARLRQQTSAFLVAWFPDALANLGRQYLLASPYHAFFFKDRHIMRFVEEKLGQPAFYLPEGCNPRWHRRIAVSESDHARYACDITIACKMYYHRALLLESLAGYDFKIWGPSYPAWLTLPRHLRRAHQNHYVAEEEKAKAFNAAKIVLNTLHYAEIDGVNARLFEIAGCGGFQISEHRDALCELFEPEREIVTFRTRQELKEKVDYYLAHPAERRAIADRAYARAHRQHTYQHRLQRLLSIVAGLGQTQSEPAHG
ncbi:MAG: glycosyltransferase [Terriglobia bacterium]